MQTRADSVRETIPKTRRLLTRPRRSRCTKTGRDRAAVDKSQIDSELLFCSSALYKRSSVDAVVWIHAPSGPALQGNFKKSPEVLISEERGGRDKHHRWQTETRLRKTTAGSSPATPFFYCMVVVHASAHMLTTKTQTQTQKHNSFQQVFNRQYSRI